MRHLTTRVAVIAAASLLLGCADADGDDDAIALDDVATDSTPVELGDERAEPNQDTDGAAHDTDEVAGGDLVDGTEAIPGTWQVGDAGTVTFAVVDGGLVLEDVTENEGWTVTDVAEEPDEIEVDFQRGDVEVEIEIEITSGGAVLEVEVDTGIEDAEPGTYDIGDAGTLTFDVVDGRLELVDLTANEGWEVTEQDVESDEIEIELRNGATRWDADVDLDGGSIELELDHEVSGRL